MENGNSGFEGCAFFIKTFFSLGLTFYQKALYHARTRIYYIFIYRLLYNYIIVYINYILYISRVCMRYRNNPCMRTFLCDIKTLKTPINTKGLRDLPFNDF